MDRGRKGRQGLGYNQRTSWWYHHVHGASNKRSICKGFEMVKDLMFPGVVIESDCKVVVNGINSKKLDLSQLRNFIQVLREEFRHHNGIFLQYISNIPAHLLAQYS